MKNRFFTLLMFVGLVGCPAAWAWDSEPDPETGLYDGLYDRPTYFPEWEQPSTWQSTMFICCDVRIGSSDGERVPSYEVAVYDQYNELRHCGRSLAEQDRVCVLTIPGEDGVDVFHFQVLYGDNFAQPTIVDVDGVTVPFETNASIGTKEAPFVLIISITPTAIDELTEGKRTQGQVYDLLGRPVNTPTNGVYVIDGQKYIIQ